MYTARHHLYTAKPESRCGDCIWSSWVEIRTSTTVCPVNVVGARLQCLFRQFNENDPEKRLAKFGSISDMNVFQNIRILLHSCLPTGTYHKNLEFWNFFLIWWIWAILSMKNPLSVFSFGQIPTQWQQKKYPVRSVQRVCWEQKRAQIAIFWGKKRQEIARDLDNEFLEVIRTNSDPKNFST
jgi:hypothetical protein